MGEEDTLTAQLATLGYRPGDVDTAIVSHLHEDHIGGLAEISDAELVVSADEWKEVTRPAAAERGFLRKHIDIPGLKWHKIRFEATSDSVMAPFKQALDLFDDGSLLLLPTPGHTAGSMSLLVRRKGKAPLLLVGDLTYAAALLERRQVPGVGKHARLLETTDMVLGLKRQMPDLVILRAHDPSAAGRLLAS